MKRFRSRSFAALAVLLALAACRREPAADEASIRQALAERPGAQVLAEAEKSAYSPPAEGRLTAAQVEMYLAVKRREARIREVVLADLRRSGGADRRGKAGALATAGVRAAQELGYNPKELRWVEDRILEAEIATAGRGMADRLEQGRRRHLERLRARRRAAADPAERGRLDRRIADFERRAAAAQPRLTPAVQHNADLLARYREQLAEVGKAEKRAGS